MRSGFGVGDDACVASVALGCGFWAMKRGLATCLRATSLVPSVTSVGICAVVCATRCVCEGLSFTQEVWTVSSSLRDVGVDVYAKIPSPHSPQYGRPATASSSLHASSACAPYTSMRLMLSPKPDLRISQDFGAFLALRSFRPQALPITSITFASLIICPSTTSTSISSTTWSWFARA